MSFGYSRLKDVCLGERESEVTDDGEEGKKEFVVGREIGLYISSCEVRYMVELLHMHRRGIGC